MRSHGGKSGFSGADWRLFTIAAVATLLVHIDAHIWNDIMDLEIDRHEKSRETGRDRPLVFGWATVDEYRRISGVITGLIVLLSVYLTVYRVFMPLLIILGFFFDYGYNHPRIALAHRRWTEWYIFPWLVVGVTVTVVYASTGLFSLLAFIVSLLHGLIATCFVVSMMRRDAVSDSRGGKRTSSVQFPGIPHSTLYGIVTLLVSFPGDSAPLARILGNPDLADGPCSYHGHSRSGHHDHWRADRSACTRARFTNFPDFELLANKLMLQQVGATVVNAVAVSLLLVMTGGM